MIKEAINKLIAGLDLTGKSLANFATEPRFAWSLRHNFGFTAVEVAEATNKARVGDFAIVQYAPGMYSGLQMAGSSGRLVSYDGLAMWLTALRLTVSSGKRAEFITICANPLQITGGEVVTTTRVEYQDRDVPGPIRYRYRKVEVQGPERVVVRYRPEVHLIMVPMPVVSGYCAPPVFREGSAVNLGVIETRESQAFFLAMTFGRGGEQLNTCPPGDGPPPPPGGGDGGDDGPPNPQDVNQGDNGSGGKIGPPPP